MTARQFWQQWLKRLSAFMVSTTILSSGCTCLLLLVAFTSHMADSILMLVSVRPLGQVLYTGILGNKVHQIMEIT